MVCHFLTLTERIGSVMTMPERQFDGGTCWSRLTDDHPRRLVGQPLDVETRDIPNEVAQEDWGSSESMAGNRREKQTMLWVTTFAATPHRI
jgi:hypothetical protein